MTEMVQKMLHLAMAWALFIFYPFFGTAVQNLYEPWLVWLSIWSVGPDWRVEGSIPSSGGQGLWEAADQCICFPSMFLSVPLSLCPPRQKKVKKFVEEYPLVRIDQKKDKRTYMKGFLLFPSSLSCLVLPVETSILGFSFQWTHSSTFMEFSMFFSLHIYILHINLDYQDALQKVLMSFLLSYSGLF